MAGLALLVRDGELPATLGTTTSKDLAAVLRRHTRKEAMTLSTLPLIRLVRTLHCKSSWHVYAAYADKKAFEVYRREGGASITSCRRSLRSPTIS